MYGILLFPAQRKSTITVESGNVRNYLFGLDKLFFVCESLRNSDVWKIYYNQGKLYCEMTRNTA